MRMRSSSIDRRAENEHAACDEDNASYERSIKLDRRTKQKKPNSMRLQKLKGTGAHPTKMNHSFTIERYPRLPQPSICNRISSSLPSAFPFSPPPAPAFKLPNSTVPAVFPAVGLTALSTLPSPSPVPGPYFNSPNSIRGCAGRPLASAPSPLVLSLMVGNSLRDASPGPGTTTGKSPLSVSLIRRVGMPVVVTAAPGGVFVPEARSAVVRILGRTSGWRASSSRRARGSLRSRYTNQYGFSLMVVVERRHWQGKEARRKAGSTDTVRDGNGHGKFTLC